MEMETLIRRVANLDLAMRDAIAQRCDVGDVVNRFGSFTSHVLGYEAELCGLPLSAGDGWTSWLSLAHHHARRLTAVGVRAGKWKATKAEIVAAQKRFRPLFRWAAGCRRACA